MPNIGYFVSSTISGISVCINKLIKLTVTTGFTSETAQGLSMTVSSLVGTILRMTAIASLMNTTSLASFWMNKNQLHAFFLLLLTWAFIPNNLQAVI